MSRLYYQQFAFPEIDPIPFDGWYRDLDRAVPNDVSLLVHGFVQDLAFHPEPFAPVVTFDMWYRDLDVAAVFTPDVTWSFPDFALNPEPLGSPLEELTLDKWYRDLDAPVVTPMPLHCVAGGGEIDAFQLSAPDSPALAWFQPLATLPPASPNRWEIMQASGGVMPVSSVPGGARYVTVDVLPSFATRVEILPSFDARVSVAPG